MTLDEMFSKLDKRAPGFEVLYQKICNTENPLVVETGCTRQPDNWFGDGQSTQVFDTMCEMHNGTLNSVDKDPNACEFAKSLVGNRTHIYCSDSIKWLQATETKLLKINRPISVLYLDSYDLDLNMWENSALHHVYELLSIKQALAPGSLVAVDDNVLQDDGGYIGKGTFIANWMHAVGKKMVFQGYQWIWEW